MRCIGFFVFLCMFGERGFNPFKNSASVVLTRSKNSASVVLTRS